MIIAWRFRDLLALTGATPRKASSATMPIAMIVKPGFGRVEFAPVLGLEYNHPEGEVIKYASLNWTFIVLFPLCLE